jgi:DNA-binding transcriptional ArsR family regulator
VVLRELAERVARLEQRLEPSSAPAEPLDEGQRFWALEELKRRTPLPAVLFTGVAETSEGGPVEWQISYPAGALLDEDWRLQASAIAALGHPSRLQILQLIARRESQTAADLAHTEGLGTTGQIYHHLRQLVAAGWLRSTTRGRHQVPPERLVPLLVILAASR